MAEDSSGKWNYKLVSVICGIKSDIRTGCKKETVQKLVFCHSCDLFHFAKEKFLSWDFHKKAVLHLQKPNKYDMLQSGVRGVQVRLYQQQIIGVNMKEEVATQTVSNTKSIVSQIAQPIQSGNFGEWVKQLWNTHGDSFIYLGKILLLVLLTVLLAWIFTRIVKRIITNTRAKVNTIDDSVSHVVFVFVRGIIWLLALLIILDLFGVNTASILTVLGTVGLAIALAMKDSMSNIAAGLMLMILRPYKTGDFVQCGAITGTIKVIGVFCTEVMTFEGVYVSVPNSVIFGTPVTNYSRNETRRAVLSVGVSYSDDIEKGVDVIKQMLQEHELVLKDPAYEVYVDTLADSSVNLTIRFWAKTETYWDAYWQVKAAVKPTLENAGLNIPFPQRVVTIVNKTE